MAINNLGNEGNHWNRFNNANMGKSARAAAEKLQAMKHKQAAGKTNETAAPAAADKTAAADDAAETQATESPAAAESKLGARERKLLAGLRKQTGNTLDKLEGKNGKNGKNAVADSSADARNSLRELLNNIDFSAFIGGMSESGQANAVQNADAAKAGAGFNYESVQMQFSLNLSVVQSVSSANGVSQSALNMSLKMDMSWLSLGMGTGSSGASGLPGLPSGVTDFLNAIGMGGLTGQSSSQSAGASSNVWDGFMDYYSPENTADRILGFATSFYPSSKFAKAEGGDTEENRQAFSDYMGAAIQKGFDQAMGILGKVDKTTQSGIDKTHELVFNGLNDFVKNGLNPNKQNQGVYANAQSWQMSLEVNYSYTRTTYTSNGQANNPAATAAPAVDAKA